VWARHRRLAQTAAALIIRCQVQNATGAVTVVADRMGRIDCRGVEVPRLPLTPRCAMP
jgi:error-prone DNA polymerase